MMYLIVFNNKPIERFANRTTALKFKTKLENRGYSCKVVPIAKEKYFKLGLDK